MEDLVKDKLKLLKLNMLKRESTLRQYSLWLQTAEEMEIICGLESCYARLEGLMQGLLGDESIPGVDIIPGTDWRNLVKVVKEIQDELKIDIGLCKYLVYDSNSTTPDYKCERRKDLFIVSPKICLPPERGKCEYRPEDYWG